jgi:hypothetical protein
VMSSLLLRSFEEQYVALNVALISAATFTLAIVALIPLLFRIGRHFET